MKANTTGTSSVAIGYHALKANTTAIGNVAVGGLALGLSTTAVGNTAVGVYCMDAVTTGGDNTAVGREALSALTTGHSNVAVGINAGTTAPATTTGTHNIFVGKAVHADAADTNYAHGFGHNLSCSGSYTTFGDGGSDIRAAFGTASWSTVSDERVKKDIVDSTAGLSFINALQPRTFKYKTLGELPDTFNTYVADSTEVFKNSNTNHGFIAQEVKAAIDADSNIKDGFKFWDDREDGSQEVGEAALIPILTKAIQELSTQNEALSARILTLENA